MQNRIGKILSQKNFVFKDIVKWLDFLKIIQIFWSKVKNVQQMKYLICLQSFFGLCN